MGYVIYDNKKIQPAPVMGIQKTYNRLDDGTIVGSSYTIVLNGFILPNKGSPNSTGVFWTGTGYAPDEPSLLGTAYLSCITKKQEALRDLFNVSNRGKYLEVMSDSGAMAVRCIPEIVEIDFEQGVWYNYCRYSITIQTNQLLSVLGGATEEFTDLIETATENWTIDNNETPIDLDYLYGVTVTHSLSAKGKPRYNGNGALIKEAWQEARSWVSQRAGYNSGIVSDPSGLFYVPNGLRHFNHIRSENIDNTGGTYSLTETWNLSPSGYTEDFNITVQKSFDNSISTVSIEGSIQGMESRENGVITTSKFEHADTYYSGIKNSIHQRAQNYSHLILNPISKSSNEAKNPLTGSINYSYEYDTRPTNIIPGAIYENIVITVNDRSDKFAAIPVLGRPDGPVLQPLNTSDEKRKTLNIEAVFSGLYDPNNLQTSFLFPSDKFSTIKDLVDPINNGATKSFLNQPQETWEPLTQRASATYEWTYE